VIYEFSGTASERGQQHGRRLARQIRARIAHTLHIGPAQRRRLAQPWLAAIDAVEHRLPLGAELRGIAAGAGVDVCDVVLLNAFEAFEVAAQVELGGCTAVALARGAGAVLAQNWDANPSLAASLAVHLHRGPDLPTTALLASPGGLGWIGMNGSGLALVTNDLLTRACRPGLASQALRRHALACRTVAEAAELIAATPAVGGRSYLLADAGGAVAGIELAVATTPRVTRYGGHAAHTNHALDPAVAAVEDTGLLGTVYPSSGARLRRAQELLDAGRGAEPVPTAWRILADHAGYPLSVCRHPAAEEPTVTAAATVFDCAARRATIALGNACTTEPVALALDD
jgi:isopenicillin-N N-acyltransferase like protein